MIRMVTRSASRGVDRRQLVLPAEVQEAALALVARGTARTLGSALKQLNNERDEAADAAALAANFAKPPDEVVTLHRADLADLHRLVGPASVDVIITQPPLASQELHLLAAFAAHALKPLARWW